MVCRSSLCSEGLADQRLIKFEQILAQKGSHQRLKQLCKDTAATQAADNRQPWKFSADCKQQPAPKPDAGALQQQLSEERQQHASELLQLEQQNAELQARADELEAEGQQYGCRGQGSSSFFLLEMKLNSKYIISRINYRGKNKFCDGGQQASWPIKAPGRPQVLYNCP